MRENLPRRASRIPILLILVCVMLSTSKGFAQKTAKGPDHVPRPATREFTVSKPDNPKGVCGHEYIDLGLPSGTKWCRYNFERNGGGVFSENSEYYAWGCFNMNDYQTPPHEVTDISGDSRYDVIRYYWGQSWHLPNEAQWFELITKCKWHNRKINGKEYAVCVGPNGKNLIFPYNGFKKVYYYEPEGKLESFGKTGAYGVSERGNKSNGKEGKMPLWVIMSPHPDGKSVWINLDHNPFYASKVSLRGVM